jgi:hypothetical protein
MTNGGYLSISFEHGTHGQEAYDVLLVFDGIRSRDVCGNLNRSAGHHWGEVPCPVLEAGDIGDGKEDDAIYDAGDYSEREVWIVHPQGPVGFGHLEHSWIKRDAWISED